MPKLFCITYTVNFLVIEYLRLIFRSLTAQVCRKLFAAETCEAIGPYKKNVAKNMIFQKTAKISKKEHSYFAKQFYSIQKWPNFIKKWVLKSKKIFEFIEFFS